MLFAVMEFPLLFLFCLTVTIVYSCGGKEKAKDTAETKIAKDAAEHKKQSCMKHGCPILMKQSCPILYYLTNLKVFLTCMVVVTHHMAVAFGGIPYAPLVIGA